jgi:hypothetical protein
MVSNVPPASIVLWLSPRGSWIGAGINRHGRREQVGPLSVELVVSYSGLFLLIA